MDRFEYSHKKVHKKELSTSEKIVDTADIVFKANSLTLTLLLFAGALISKNIVGLTIASISITFFFLIPKIKNPKIARLVYIIYHGLWLSVTLMILLDLLK